MEYQETKRRVGKVIGVEAIILGLSVYFIGETMSLNTPEMKEVGVGDYTEECVKVEDRVFCPKKEDCK